MQFKDQSDLAVSAVSNGKTRFVRLLALSFAVLVCWGQSTRTLADGLAVVGFDAPAVVVAEVVDPSSANTPMAGGKLIRIRVPVTAFVSPEFRGRVSEVLVELESPHQTLRVVDFWPREELYTDVEGTVKVEESTQTDAQAGFNLSAGLEPFARGAAQGQYAKKNARQESYQKKPPMQVLTSSGTARRGYGAFFKFRAGPQTAVEGTRQIAILAEVPTSWRGDLVKINMSATGSERPQDQQQERLGVAQQWMTLHQQGDQVAATKAKLFVVREHELRVLAAQKSEHVAERAYPTVFHRIGAAMDIIEPRIRTDYLTHVLFGNTQQYFQDDSRRLPVDLKVAILDFWDAKKAVLSLAQPHVGQHELSSHVSMTGFELPANTAIPSF